MKSNLNIGAKLMAGTSTLFLLAAALGLCGLLSLNNLKAKFDRVVDQSVRKVALSDAILTANSEMISAQRGIILAAFGKNSVELQTYRKTFEHNLNVIHASVTQMRSLPMTEQAKISSAEVEGKLSEWLPFYRQVVEHAQAGDIAEANRIRSDVTAPLYKKINSLAVQLTELETTALETEKKSVANQFAFSRGLALGLLGLFLLVGGIVFLVIRKISADLRGTITDLLGGAEQVGSAASQISSSSQQLAQGSSQQAASLEETSASTEQINAMARQNSSKSNSAAQLVDESLDKFGKANESLEAMRVAMTEINLSSEKVSRIIKVIDDIAFQTNILALNAAVEAARAGDAGLGFAVVADEVRNLAQRSAQAARDTTALIEESISKADAGKLRANQVTEAIRQVADDSAKVKILVDDVKHGSQEQAKGLEQIGKAIVLMEQLTQGTAASAEESASASVQLSSQAQTLKNIVGRLTAMVGRV